MRSHFDVRANCARGIQLYPRLGTTDCKNETCEAHKVSRRCDVRNGSSVLVEEGRRIRASSSGILPFRPTVCRKFAEWSYVS